MAGFLGMELPRMPGETAADYNRRHKAFLKQQDYELQRAKLADDTKIASEKILYSPENVQARAASTAAWAAPTGQAIVGAAGAISSIYGGGMASSPNVTPADYGQVIGQGLSGIGSALAPPAAPAPAADVGFIPGTTQNQSLVILGVAAVLVYMATKK